MTVELNVLFKKMQKDDKKEVLEFHILGDEPRHQTELIGMAGGIAVLDVEGVKLSAEFKNIQRDSKKIALKFEAKGDSESEIVKLYPKAGWNVNLILEPSQMSIDEFREMDPHEGIEYGVNTDGTVNVPDGQLDMNEIEVEEEGSEGLPFTVGNEEQDEDDLLD